MKFLRIKTKKDLKFKNTKKKQEFLGYKFKELRFILV